MIYFDSEDAIKMEILIGISKRGYYCNGKDVTDLYNRIFNKNLNPTTCATCIRQRYQELYKAYKEFVQDERLDEKCRLNMGRNVRRMFPQDVENFKTNKARNEQDDYHQASTNSEKFKKRDLTTQPKKKNNAKKKQK